MSEFETIIKVIPGFGYSVNCQPEIFAGLSPDELGFFCEWTYDPKNSPFKKWKVLFNILDPAKKIYYFDRLLHKIVDKVSMGVKNIPFAYLPKMAKDSHDIFSEAFDCDSLLKRKNVVVYSTQEFLHLHPRERDNIVYQRTLSFIDSMENNHLVAAQTELDGIAHWHGVGSDQYENCIQLLDQRIARIKEKFFNRFQKGKMIVVSDHGMANVKDCVKIELEKKFGRPNDKTYCYFLEGTILRIWIFNSVLKEEIAEYLESLGMGSIIDSSQRNHFGISKKIFGDIIYLIDEGLMFVPSFWGGKISKAMHGYHPNLESQKGILLCSHEEEILPRAEMTGKDVFLFLKEQID